jgi:tetratricopeptide (TPR) repeat protein
MPDSREALALGLQYLRAGQFQQAEQVYRQVLETDPANADALTSLAGICLAQDRAVEAVAAFQQAVHVRPLSAELHNDLGVAFAQAGKSGEAAASFRQALQCRPDFAEAHNNLGIVLAQQGRLNEAIGSYQQALQIKTDYAEGLSNLGLALATLGKLSEAVASHQRALEINPDFAAAQNNLRAALTAQDQLNREFINFRMNQWYLADDAVAYNELGLALKTQGRLTEAITSFQEAIRFRPDLTEAYNNLGVTLKDRGNADEAAASLRHALALNPAFAEAHNNLGTVLESEGRLDEASACYGEALRGKPDFAEAQNNLGVVLNKQGKYAEARICYQEALRLKPDYPDAHHNLGTLLVDHGKLDEGLASYERALQLNPEYAEAHLGRAQAWLQMGDFERGWTEFEWRWRRNGFPPRPFPQPLWDSGPLAGRTILLHAEQGLGDTLQFIRYAPLVKERGGWVIVECQETLLPLLATCSGIDQLVAHGSPLPYFDRHAPLVSLPRIFQTDLATVPAENPYLFADPASVERWQEVLKTAGSSTRDGFKIGIAWQGNPGHINDRNRSVPLTFFEPLARLDGVHLFSLQKGPGTEQLAGASERFSITDLGSQFENFQDTAAVLKSLDLVVTVDSAVAHCAGALGIPVWVLLPYAADWRWLLHRQDNPWYPTMRLFRQVEPGNWPDVFTHLLDETRKLLDTAGAATSVNVADSSGLDKAAIAQPDRLALAIQHQETGELHEAEALYHQILNEDPDQADALSRLAVICLEAGRFDEASVHYEQLLRLRPNDPAVHSDLGISYAQVGKLSEAGVCFRNALNANSEYAEAHNNLGVVLAKQDQIEEAAANYRQALRVKPNHPEAHHNLGNALRDLGQPEEALAHYQEAVRVKPDHAQAHTNLAMIRLLMGDFEQGWREYEWRWKCPDFPHRSFAQPGWDGGSLAGRKILLHAEQGLGDTLQFIRYVPLVTKRGGFVIVECPKTLRPLLATCSGIDRLVSYGSPLPGFDTHAPLMSLPLLLGTTLATIPADVPYLNAAPELREYWRQELSSIAGLKVGIFWQGDPRHRRDRQRSVPLMRFAPLAQLAGVKLCSLQEGPGSDQQGEAAARFPVIDMASRFQNFGDTAAALVNLDLVITVDSAVAHCAGALGVPVWLLLPYGPDWRWLLEREDSPWYPTMRLFRQKAAGDWDGVFARVAAELSGLVERRTPGVEGEAGNASFALLPTTPTGSAD